MGFLTLLFGLLAAPAWHPDAWLDPPARITDVELDGRMFMLRWEPASAGSVEVTASDDRRTITLALAGFDSTRPPLPAAHPPLVRLAWSMDGQTPVLRLERAEAAPYHVEHDPDGVTVGLSAAALPRLSRVQADLSGLWSDLPGEARRALHEALDLARKGSVAVALERIRDLGERVPDAKVPAARAEAEVLRSVGLVLLAMPPLIEVALNGHPTQRAEAIDALLQTSASHPTAWQLAPDALAALTDGTDLRLDLESARLAILDRDPERAGPYLLRAAQRRDLRPRARYLAHAAARLAGDFDAAAAHLDALIDGAGIPSDLRFRARLGRARLAYDAGDFEMAGRLFQSLRSRAPADADLTTELAWLDMQADRALAVLERHVHVDLQRDGPGRALLVGTAYLRLCHSARAAAVASGIIEFARRTPLERQLDIEAGMLANRRMARVAKALGRRVDALRSRSSARSTMTYAARMRRQAHRLRFSADMRTADELRRRRSGRVSRPAESADFGWQGSAWRDEHLIHDSCEGSKPTL